MGARFSSHRFRRRLAWSVGALASVSAAVVAAVVVGNTGRHEATPLSSRKAWVYREPRGHRLTRNDLDELQRTSVLFIRTAVARRNLARAWEIAGPELRAGMSRAAWTSGDNTVVPFPADRITAWAVDYSYENDVAFDVSLHSKPPYDTIGKTFMIELKRPPRLHRWQVAYWAPKGVSSLDTSRAFRRAPAPPTDLGRTSLSPRWLVLPGALLAGALLVLASLGARSALRSRRAARRYGAELARYRSSSSPS